MSFSIWILDSRASHHFSLDLTYHMETIKKRGLFCFFISYIFCVCHDYWWHSYAFSWYWFIITPHLSFSNVYHFPNSTFSRLCWSIMWLWLLIFLSLYFLFCARLSQFIGKGQLYILGELKVPTVATPSFDLFFFHLCHSSFSFYLWHCRLGQVLTSHLK